jgi:hypothetical protein
LKGAVASGELERSTMLCSWVNQLFRLGHCQKPTVSLPEDMSATNIHMWTTTGVWEHGVFAAMGKHQVEDQIFKCWRMNSCPIFKHLGKPVAAHAMG